LSVQYISKRGQEYLGLTIEKIQQLGQEYYTDYFNKEDLDDYAPKVTAMFERNNTDDQVSFFQQVRRDLDASWAWHFSTSRIFMQDPDGRPLLSITISLPVDPEQHVTSKLERLLEEYIFFRKNKKLYLSLTVREKEILKLLALSKSATDIAEDLIISPYTVETHRKNLRKKLNITSSYELNKFARAFDLI
jgi:DNA-binding CsgD family transcriptional regulator